MDKPTLSWRAPEFYYYKKESAWYTITAAIAVLLVLYFLVFRQLDWTAALLVVASAFALFRLGNHKPKQVQVEITSTGVTIGDNTVDYAALASFHLTNHNDYLSLDIHKKSRASLPLSALVGDQKPDNIRSVLGKYLPEKTQDTVYINDVISRLIRF